MNMTILKDTVTMDNIISRVKDIQSRCTDSYSDQLKMVQDGRVIWYRDENGCFRQNKMSEFSFSQLCNHMGVPTSYMNTCFDKGKEELVKKNLNTWLNENEKTFFLRRYQKDDEVVIRGMLTSKYTKFDSPEILDIVTDRLNVDDYDICGHFLNEERLHIRLKEKELLPIPGEDLFGGIMIDTSDVGRCGFRISYFVYKQICTNGLCLSKGGGLLYNQKHIGIRPDEVAAEINRNLTLLPKFREEIIAQIKASKNHEVSDLEIEKIMAKLKKQQGVGDKNLEKIISLMDTTYDRSRFGLINGITEVAQEYSLEKRIELERFAGNLLLVA